MLMMMMLCLSGRFFEEHRALPLLQLARIHGLSIGQGLRRHMILASALATTSIFISTFPALKRIKLVYLAFNNPLISTRWLVKLVEKIRVRLEGRVIKVVTSSRKFASNALVVLLTVWAENSTRIVLILIARVSCICTYGASDPFAILVTNPTIATGALSRTECLLRLLLIYRPSTTH